MTFYVKQQAVRIYGVYVQTDFLKLSHNFYKVFTGPDGLLKLYRHFCKMFTGPDRLFETFTKFF